MLKKNWKHLDQEKVRVCVNPCNDCNPNTYVSGTAKVRERKEIWIMKIMRVCVVIWDLALSKNNVIFSHAWGGVQCAAICTVGSLRKCKPDPTILKRNPFEIEGLTSQDKWIRLWSNYRLSGYIWFGSDPSGY
jgi:hypothetical protein